MVYTSHIGILACLNRTIRLGLDEEKAFEKAYEMNDELIANNYVECPEAKLTIFSISP